MPLSDSDALMGANLFMSKEMEKSSYLYSFIKTRGAPTAIELAQASMGTTRLIMFYAREQEVYTASPTERETGRQWVVRGPYQIDWRDNRQIQRVQKAMQDEPVFNLWGKTQRFATRHRYQPEKIVQPVLPPLPPPARTRRAPTRRAAPKRPVSAKVVATATPAPTQDPAQFRPSNIDQKALLMAQGFAERAENGDLIHTVKTENQSLDKITKWYTGSDKNVAEVAQFNGTTPEKKIVVGERIHIPLNLIREFKAMPDE
ncbi:MAG: hypothetical protein GX589_08590 [Deltaproteobacteria bacterium]|nr:hypothetical protein [Deltaproteobacteria bacterium]